MQIWLCSIQIDFLLFYFLKIYTSHSCKLIDMSQFVECTCARSANENFLSNHGLITDLITRNSHLYFLKKTIKIHITHK